MERGQALRGKKKRAQMQKNLLYCSELRVAVLGNQNTEELLLFPAISRRTAGNEFLSVTGLLVQFSQEASPPHSTVAAQLPGFAHS